MCGTNAFNRPPCLYKILSHNGRVVENSHAAGVDECFPAKLDVGDVPEAGQQPFANQHVAMPCVVSVPILVQYKQDRHMSTVHSTPSISFCRYMWKREREEQKNCALYDIIEANFK